MEQNKKAQDEDEMTTVVDGFNVRSSRKIDKYHNAKESDDLPIVIDRSRNRYYFRPGKNYLNEEWE